MNIIESKCESDLAVLESYKNMVTITRREVLDLTARVYSLEDKVNILEHEINLKAQSKINALEEHLVKKIASFDYALDNIINDLSILKGTTNNGDRK